nr:PREDICTED: uncharacterized protein LOC107398208 [Tribolium castaneum]|eukprot:XP_015837034.1 PREDICTED: uncharacterized protein LOC107398208 [Tribolium castaneum]
MGCSVGHKETTVNSLCDWISKVKFKKTNCKLQKRRNLLVQAVLSSALSRAETELKMKQQERRLKWEFIKAKTAQKIDSSSDVRWDDTVCQEVNSSLDQFMSQMKLVQFSKA